MSIQILLTPREYQQLLSKLPTGLMSMALQSVSHDTLQPSDKTIRDVSVPVNAILTDLPETAQTKALSATINTYLANDFVINHVDAAKGQQNLCKYSSSRPDFCFYHTKNYFYESNIFAAVTSTTPGGAIEESGFEPDTDINPDTDSHAGTIYGASGKNKIRDPYTGPLRG